MDGSYSLRRQGMVDTYESVRTLMIQRVVVWRIVRLLEVARVPETEREAYIRGVDDEYQRVCAELAREVSRVSDMERYHLSLLEAECGNVGVVGRRMLTVTEVEGVRRIIA